MNDKQKQVNEMIAEIDQLADKLIKESKQLRIPLMKVGIVVALIALFAYSASSSAACTYSKDAWGNTKYSCDGGNGGTLRTDAWGNTRDSGTGLTYKKDAWGNTRASDGTTYRKDAWGNTIITNSNGRTTTCRPDAWGNTRCN